MLFNFSEKVSVIFLMFLLLAAQVACYFANYNPNKFIGIVSRKKTTSYVPRRRTLENSFSIFQPSYRTIIRSPPRPPRSYGRTAENDDDENAITYLGTRKSGSATGTGVSYRSYTRATSRPRYSGYGYLENDDDENAITYLGTTENKSVKYANN